MTQLSKQESKEAAKEAIKEWMDEQFTKFGKTSLRFIMTVLFCGIVYLVLKTHGWVVFKEALN